MNSYSKTKQAPIGHTPGPWVVTGISQDTGSISVGAKAQRIVIADVTNAASFGDMLSGAMRRGGGRFDQSDCATQHANARLIAAAPDMFDALQKAEEWLSGWASAEPYLTTIRAALSKAVKP